ncbi:MAG: DUF6134 family protein [Bacteroidota bacterium]
MKYIICSLFAFLLSIPLFSQHQDRLYEIKALGTEIGSATVSKHISGDTTYYLTQSLLEVNLLIKKIRMEVTNRTNYYEGQLISSEATVVVNGKVHTSSSVVWQDPDYLVRIDNDPKEPINFPVVYSGTLLYFQEPQGIKEAFSETSGLFMRVEQEKEGQYTVTDLKNDRDMLHFYEEGVLTNIKIKHPLLTVSINLIKPIDPAQ